MPLIVWFIRGNKEYGIWLIGQVQFCPVWCMFTHEFIILGYFGFQRVNARNILEKNGLRLLQSYGATRSSPLYNG